MGWRRAALATATLPTAAFRLLQCDDDNDDVCVATGGYPRLLQECVEVPTANSQRFSGTRNSERMVSRRFRCTL